MKSLPAIVPAPAPRSERITFRYGPRHEVQVVRTVADPLIPEPIERGAA